MNRFELKMLQERAYRVVRNQADEYADILVMGEANSAENVQAVCTLTFAGYTPAKFMMAWAHGEFDA